MKTIDLENTFHKHSDEEFLKFDRVQNKTSNRADLHAFILLDKLMPDSCDIVSAAEHDEIYLSVNCQELAKVITEEQIVELLRCGVGYNSGYDCLSLFV